MGPNLMTGVLKRRGKFGHRHTHTHRERERGRIQCEMEAEFGVSKLGNTKDCWQPPEARKRQGRILPSSLHREHGPISDFCKIIRFCSFKSFCL